MKSKVFLLFIAIPLNLFCQTNKPDVLTALGGSGLNAEFSMNWTLGEIFIDEFSNGDFILAQGFHQGYPGMVTSVNTKNMNVDITVYPNPVADKLNVHIQNDRTDINWRFEVFDIFGIKIIDDYSKGSKNEIDFSSLIAGTYLVRVSHNNYFKVFHIIKNDFSHEKN